MPKVSQGLTHRPGFKLGEPASLADSTVIFNTEDAKERRLRGYGVKVKVGRLAGKNLLQYTNAIGLAYPNAYTTWTRQSVLVNVDFAPESIAPSGVWGTSRVSPIQTFTGLGNYVRQDVPKVSGVTYTLSVHAKAAFGNDVVKLGATDSNSLLSIATFDLTHGTCTGLTGLGAAAITAVGSWYRISYTYPSDGASGEYLFTYDDPGVDVFAGVYLWGAQLEIGALTAYQPVVGAT